MKDAHRLIPISPQDWHLLACRSEKTKQVYVNMTGTFGVASAACWWSRVATAAIRGAHYILGHELASWLLLVADDLAMLIPHSKIREAVLLLLVYLRVMGFPLSWEKSSGGESLQWGWVRTRPEKLSSPVSALHVRSGWKDGTRVSSATAQYRCRSSKKDWGRAAFVCGALDYDRPFLAPLYSFASRHAPQSVKPLPLYVMVTLEYLRKKILQRRHCECGLRRQSWEQAWRVDAHADENGVGVGGWCLQANDQGVVTKWGSPWFAVKVTPDTAPWAFQREGKAYRVIATLEALGLLLALMAFGPGERLSNTSLTVQVPAFTDNRGNGYVINKLMTTRFPLCTVIMELAAQAERRGVRMEAEWTPRD